jgi:16S rRNA (uracil1498-N3)-methyltransferase
LARHIPRIYIENLSDNIFEIPQKQFYHLFSVLRFSTGQEFISFNKIDGEWLCSVLAVGKKSASGKKLKLLRDFSKSPALYLAFCSIKNDKAKLIIEKGTELGVTKFYPLISQYSNSKLNIEKLTTIAVAASEQSERIDIPIINSPLNIVNFLENLPPKVVWFSCIERESQFSDLELKNKHSVL